MEIVIQIIWWMGFSSAVFLGGVLIARVAYGRETRSKEPSHE